MVDLSPGAVVSVVNPTPTVQVSAPGLVEHFVLLEGPPGPPGANGSNGAATTTYRGAWSAATTYVANDTTEDQNALWRAVTPVAGTRPASPAWEKVADIPDMAQAQNVVRVRCATIANSTLSGLNATGLDISGSLNAGDLVVVPNQNSGASNGIYVASAGAWARWSGADTMAKMAAQIVEVSEGTTYGGTTLFCAARSTDTLGTSSPRYGYVAKIEATPESGAFGKVLYMSAFAKVALTNTATQGNVLTFNGTVPTWMAPTSVFASRTTASKTTASLADGAAETGTITMATGYRLLKVQTDRAARVRVYATAAQRDADLSRAVGTDPTGDHGLLMEYVTTGAATVGLSPMVDGYSLESTPSSSIPITITNKSGAASTVVVTLTYVRTE